jgi:putative ABC transport system permease protein
MKVPSASGDPTTFGPALRSAVHEVDAGQPVHHVRSMDGMVAGSLAPQRFVTRILGFFALTALFLSALGLYGVISYSVSQRTQEIGVRMALGARRATVLRLVVLQGLRLASVGVVLGIAASAASARLLQTQLFEVSALDPMTFLLTAAVLVGASALASFIPAQRATRIDPLEALRYE